MTYHKLSKPYLKHTNKISTTYLNHISRTHLTYNFTFILLENLKA